MDLTTAKTLIFDYDGTIHDSLAIYKPAFLKVFNDLVHQGYKKPSEIIGLDITKYLGMTPKEMWDDFGKDLPESVKQASSKKIGFLMQDAINNNQAKLYPNAIKTLITLKEMDYTLVFLSNCTNAYMKAHTKLFGLDKIFDQMINAEMYDFIPKEAILKLLKPSLNSPMVMIGDRIHDIRTGKMNDIYTIGCTYGFGNHQELEDADLTIDSISELLNYF